MPTTEEFREAIMDELRTAVKRDLEYLDINSGALHRKVGGYPGPDHRMPACCDVMRKLMGPRDLIIQEPEKGKGASLTIRYYLPR